MLDQVWGKSKCGSQRAVLILACHLRASVMRKVVHLCIRIRSKHLCWYKRRLLQVVLLSTRGRYLMEHKSCLLRNCAIFGKNTEYRLNEWSILFISALFFISKLEMLEMNVLCLFTLIIYNRVQLQDRVRLAFDLFDSCISIQISVHFYF